ncbi:MAG: hypothetical protein ABW080_07085 [Candidatus Thiodiazotropha sp.]
MTTISAAILNTTGLSLRMLVLLKSWVTSAAELQSACKACRYQANDGSLAS